MKEIKKIAQDIATALVAREIKMELITGIFDRSYSLNKVKKEVSEWGIPKSPNVVLPRLAEIASKRVWQQICVEFIGESEDDEDELVKEFEALLIEQLSELKTSHAKVIGNIPRPSEVVNRMEGSTQSISNLTAIKSLATDFFFHKQNQVALKLGKTTTAGRTPPLLISGPTGCGKTHICRKVAEIYGVCFIQVDASRLIPEGIVGFSVIDLARSIYEQAGRKLGVAEHAVVYLDEFDKLLTSTYRDSVIGQLLTLIDGTGTLHFYKDDRSKSSPEIKISTKNMLFILSGSFGMSVDREFKRTIGFTNHDEDQEPEQDLLLRSNFPDEIKGRIGRVVTVSAPDDKALANILINADDSPLQRLKHRCELFDIDYVVSDLLVESLISESKSAITQFGIRGLFRSAESYLSDNEVEYLMPENAGGKVTLMPGGATWN